MPPHLSDLFHRLQQQRGRSVELVLPAEVLREDVDWRACQVVEEAVEVTAIHRAASLGRAERRVKRGWMVGGAVQGDHAIEAIRRDVILLLPFPNLDDEGGVGVRGIRNTGSSSAMRFKY